MKTKCLMPRHLFIILAVALGASAAWAIDAAQVPEAKRTPLGLYLTARETADMKNQLGDKALFVDVRSRAEATFLGMPSTADALIPAQDFSGETTVYDERAQTFALEANLDFVSQFDALLKAKGLGTNDTIIVMCRSGGRSATAVALLAKYGYTKVYTMVDGYEGDPVRQGPQAGQRVLNGWRVEGLPWSYRLPRDKVLLKP